MLTKSQLLEPLVRRRIDEVVVTTMSAVRPWGLLSNHDLDFASADSAMAHAADLALGIALAQPERRVICLNGDGSMLMSLGTLATIVEAAPRNYILFVLVNGTYEITGNQSIPAAATIDWLRLARAAGFPRFYHFDVHAAYESALDEIMAAPGPTFVSVSLEPGSEGPISRRASEPARYLQTSIADWSRHMRNALAAGSRT